MKNLILADSYHESRLYVDSKPSQNWICIDADMPYGHGIYFSSDENRIYEVLPQIRRICNTINNEVAEEIAQYRILNNTIDRSLREFQRKLNIILHKTKLPLKNHLKSQPQKGWQTQISIQWKEIIELQSPLFSLLHGKKILKAKIL